MRAAIRDDTGLAFVERPRPAPGPDEVLVRVRAVALNRADLGVLAGHMHGSVGGSGTILGMEWAGEALEVGGRVASVKPGDRIMGSGAAAFAEFTVADFGRVYPIPDGIDFERAATLPVALQTMHDAVVVNGRLQHGESVLVLGASSGVGLMALQIAKKMGAALVVGSSTNAARRSRLGEFGADLAIDSSSPEWPEQIREATGGRGVDLIVDQLSGPTINASMKAAAVLGRIVNVGRLAGSRGDFDFDLHALKRVDYIGVTHRTRSVDEIREECRKTWADLAPAVGDGSLTLPISARFPFEQLGEAFALMRANEHFGKIVVTMLSG
ncbi:MAG TPA: zinc-binding dehydrogenase [Burkholderiaceae bacterium]|nr:zinc-binding dehydrogenase [Burkholderiaceae bacterium]